MRLDKEISGIFIDQRDLGYAHTTNYFGRIYHAQGCEKSTLLYDVSYTDLLLVWPVLSVGELFLPTELLSCTEAGVIKLIAELRHCSLDTALVR